VRERVENCGAINMRALEEYQELEERYQFLSSQRADIEQSIADTQKAIAEINRRSVEQFQEAFKNIRENFIEVFQILFKGGQCDLRLLDEGDLLESGVDIVAQPPGKRLQNVLLLSGGEKALTALALLIAIFRYRPSPFCVLDEVDAPLDDANVIRFTELISTLSKDTQFLLVTHNKKTMEIAQTLYGVTMEEPGVSKIVSVDLHPHQEALAS
jgi:chromosome segregation protein